MTFLQRDKNIHIWMLIYFFIVGIFFDLKRLEVLFSHVAAKNTISNQKQCQSYVIQQSKLWPFFNIFVLPILNHLKEDHTYFCASKLRTTKGRATKKKILLKYCGNVNCSVIPVSMISIVCENIINMNHFWSGHDEKKCWANVAP